MPCQITVRLLNGRVFSREKVDYEGFHTHPMSWERTVEKFKRLSDASIDSRLQKKIIDTVLDLDRVPIEDLMALLRG
jgi:2-methylcitrate dehydratase